MITEIAKNFLIDGDFVDAEPFGSGHINDTFLATFNQSGIPAKYVIRKINTHVFKNPGIVIQNTINVTRHITKKLLATGEKEITRKVLTLIKSKDGTQYYIDENKNYWCAFVFISDAYSVDKAETLNQAYIVAKEFGKFQKYLIDEDINKYEPTIPNFHNVGKRLQVLKNAIQRNPLNRVKYAEQEIELSESNKHMAGNIEELLINKWLPLRITHNDDKINNVMLDRKTGNGICVVDLDTTMPGTVIYDFGDLVRTLACGAAEDEKDISEVFVRLEFFDAIAKGYLEELAPILTCMELYHLVYGAELIIYEQAIRFLTDYLDGDKYYKVEYSDQNLVRTKNQFALLKNVQLKRNEMERIVDKYCYMYGNKNERAVGEEYL